MAGTLGIVNLTIAEQKLEDAHSSQERAALCTARNESARQELRARQEEQRRRLAKIRAEMQRRREELEARQAQLPLRHDEPTVPGQRNLDVHMARAGETLRQIAESKGISFEELARQNPQILDIEAALLANQAILIRQATTELPEPDAPAESTNTAGSLVGEPLTEEETALIGAAYDESNPPVQAGWTEWAINFLQERARTQGILTPEHIQISEQLADTVFADGAARQLGPADIAQLARAAGIPIERLDGPQLLAAANYVNGEALGAHADANIGGSAADQRTRLSKALCQLQFLNAAGMPELTKEDSQELLWNVARVPGHAVEKMNDGELRGTVQDVCAAANTPGEHKIKVGAHNLSLTIGDNHAVTETETKKPGLLSKIGGVLKKALPIVSTVLMFVPGVGTAIGLALKIATAAMSAVDAVKSAMKGDWLGMVTSAAGAVAGGLAAGASGVAGRIRDVASTVSRVGRGVESIQQGGIGGIVSGVAGAAGGVADGLGDNLGNFGESLQTFSRYAQPAGSGFSAAQAAAQGNWAAAFNLGVGAAAAVNSFGDGNTLGIGERGLDALQAASRGVSMADAISRGDYSAAAANALALAGDLRAAADGRPENDELRVDYLRRAGEAALAGENLRAAIDSGDFGAIGAALGQLGQVNAELQARRESAEEARVLEHDRQVLEQMLSAGDEARARLLRWAEVEGAGGDKARAMLAAIGQAQLELATAVSSHDEARIAEAKARYDALVAAAVAEPFIPQITEETLRAPELDPESVKSHTVEPSAVTPSVHMAIIGDDISTVWDIAIRTGVSVDEIIAYNNAHGNPIDFNSLGHPIVYEGQEILVPMTNADPNAVWSEEQIASAKEKADISDPPLNHVDETELDTYRNYVEHFRSNVDPGSRDGQWLAALSQRVDELERLMHDPTATPEQVDTARTDALLARLAFEKKPGARDFTFAPVGDDRVIRMSAAAYDVLYESVAVGSPEAMLVALEQLGPNDIQNLYILDHGRPGAQGLGTGELELKLDPPTGEPVLISAEFEARLVQLLDRFGSDAVISLEGCNVANTERGRELLEHMAGLTGIPVRAGDFYQTIVTPGYEGRLVTAYPPDPSDPNGSVTLDVSGGRAGLIMRTLIGGRVDYEEFEVQGDALAKEAMALSGREAANLWLQAARAYQPHYYQSSATHAFAQTVYNELSVNPSALSDPTSPANFALIAMVQHDAREGRDSFLTNVHGLFAHDPATEQQIRQRYEELLAKTWQGLHPSQRAPEPAIRPGS